MTRREKLIDQIERDLASFIYDMDLEYGNEACVEKCQNNTISCPYGEKHNRSKCIQCTNEYLDKEVDF